MKHLKILLIIVLNSNVLYTMSKEIISKTKIEAKKNVKNDIVENIANICWIALLPEWLQEKIFDYINYSYKF